MPSNTNILLIRHAEKPAEGTGLAPAGKARAQAYVAYFQDYAIGQAPIELHYIFAAADSHESHRPRHTVEPLAKALGLEIDDKYADKDYAALAHHLLTHEKYDGRNLLVCWHHGEILQLAAALMQGGVAGPDAPASGGALPLSARWPSHWPGDVFGWVLQLSWGAGGSLDPAQTFCQSERLMYDDCGQEPPGAPPAA
jgi:hypothetical protein